ncbi:MAG: hypothetical protein K5856_04900, partial [Bacteroidaceae bacterium]|nr:hypothetical protein [Bacteroidaceae bacterium]
MKKIKFLMMAMMAVVLAGTFSSCKKDEKIVEVEKEVEKIVEVEKKVEVPVDNAYSRYLNAV